MIARTLGFAMTIFRICHRRERIALLHRVWPRAVIARAESAASLIAREGGNFVPTDDDCAVFVVVIDDEEDDDDGD